MDDVTVSATTVEVWYDFEGEEFRTKKEAVRSGVRKKIRDLWHNDEPNCDWDGAVSPDDFATWLLDRQPAFEHWFNLIREAGTPLGANAQDGRQFRPTSTDIDHQ